MDVPGSGCVRLLGGGGRQHLFHVVTHELVALPECPEAPWTMAFDENDFAFVRSGSDVYWAGERLANKLVKDEEMGLVLFVGDECRSLQDEMWKHRRHMLMLRYGGALKELAMYVFFMRQPMGLRIWWWGLHSLWKSRALSTTLAGEWIATRARRWGNGSKSSRCRCCASGLSAISGMHVRPSPGVGRRGVSLQVH